MPWNCSGPVLCGKCHLESIKQGALTERLGVSLSAVGSVQLLFEKTKITSTGMLVK